MRHTRDIREALTAAGCDDWMPNCFALGMNCLGITDTLFRTRVFASRQFALPEHLSNILAAEWGVPLAKFVRSKLKLTEMDFSKLRLAFCK
eukprot:3817453-Pleurochrysis_carterae.AAC.1